MKKEKYGPHQKYGPYRPLLISEEDRRDSIKKNKPALFEINERRKPQNNAERDRFNDAKRKAENFAVDLRTLDIAGKIAVQKNDQKIVRYSQKHNMDPDMVRAIIYAENARGYYGYPVDMIGLSKSVFPMNIRPNIWSDLIDGKEKDLYDPNYNVKTGVLLLSRIRDRVQKPTPQKIGSLWNSLSGTHITEFGDYVGTVYKDKPWKK